MPEQHVRELTVAQLRLVAQKLGLRGASRMSKAALVAAVAEAQAGDTAEQSGLTVRQLRRQALDLGIHGAGRMRKGELMERLAGLTGPSSAPPSPAAVAHEEPQPPADAETFAFPETYGVDKVVLLPRDSRYLFAYWDVSNDTRAEIVRQGITSPDGDWRRVLRLHDVTGAPGGEVDGSTWVADLELDDAARDYYLEAPEEDRLYRVEFGYRDGVGTFLRIACSGVALVPRSAPVSQYDSEWGTLEDFEEAYRLSTGASGRGTDDATSRLRGFFQAHISSGHFSASAGSGR
ncbi:MAG: DUF4912 domain-containing protein [Armatimonadetes bacterium]|nr:DUF4912 domain-containing protein [Armatimonadota bacterium]